MSWKRATFKEKQVWVEVDASGRPKAAGGRAPIRYSNRSGAKIYRAAAGRIQIHEGAAAESLPEGASASASGGSGGGRTRRGSGFGKAGTRTSQQAANAKASAGKLIASLGDDTVVIFTDGACRGNPGPAGSGAVVALTDGRRAEGCRALGRATNNVAELTAVDLALDMLDAAEVAPEAPVAILSDSDYTNGVLCRGWKAKANTALILGLRERLAARPGTTIHWVAGHVGIDGNERADALAGLGVGGQSWIRGLEPPDAPSDEA